MKFIEEYGLYIFAVIFAIVFLGVVGIPVCIKLARYFWHWALM